MPINAYSIVEEFKVSYKHQVVFTENIFDVRNPLLATTIQELCRNERTKIFIVIDAPLLEAIPILQSQIDEYFTHHNASLQMVACWSLPGGEQLKNHAEYLQNLYTEIDKHDLCRHSCVLAIGGGALLDLVGYAAATAHRGIRHIRLPTTSLSQGDGGCGVKNSVNFATKKNFLGTFTPPHAVLNDLNFLNALPQPQLIDGYIEAVKVALIKDADFFRMIEQQADALVARNPKAIAQVIQTSARHHILHITRNGDPFELTTSRPLDFGHWAAHKLEAISDFTLSHGQAVAIGIALDSIYSQRTGFLDENQLERILNLIEALGFKCFHITLSQRIKNGDYLIVKGLEEFRQHLGGQLTIPLIREIGAQFEVHEMDKGILEDCIDQLKQRTFNPVE